jgi:hypothetical protein
MCGYMDQSDFPFLNIVSQEMIPNIYVLGLEWSIGFFTTIMALVLSHWSGTRVYSSPKLLMVYVI